MKTTDVVFGDYVIVHDKNKTQVFSNQFKTIEDAIAFQDKYKGVYRIMNRNTNEIVWSYRL